jgi:hypothetical protein
VTKKQKSLVALTFLAPLVTGMLTGCGGSNGLLSILDPAKSALVGTWGVSTIKNRVTYTCPDSWNLTTGTGVVLNIPDGCGSNDSWTFSSNNTYKSVNDGVSSKGTWEISDGILTITDSTDTGNPVLYAYTVSGSTLKMTDVFLANNSVERVITLNK